MRSMVVALIALLYSMSLVAQDTDAKLQSELEALHAKWYKAYDGGDGVTMDKLEVANLMLIMPTGDTWTKTKPRAGDVGKSSVPVERTLSNVTVHRFGETAVLMGILNSKTPTETGQVATIVVFVRSSGQWKIASAQWTPVAKMN